jgi:hypothetical protein
MTEVELTVGLPPTSKVPELFKYAESLGYIASAISTAA